jgi:hypothetical protein
MALNNEQPMSTPASQYAAQLRKAQQNLKQFIPKYRRLVDLEKRLRQENYQLREEIEHFNQKLVTREQELDEITFQMDEFRALLQRIHQETHRSPALHARPPVRQKLLQAYHNDSSTPYQVPRQDILPLNIWLVSSNRFIEQVISYYARKRERLLIIEQGLFVQRLLEVGIYPDIILTGAYDFGLDDPFQQSFFAVLNELSHQAPEEIGLQACFIITLSASIPKQTRPGDRFPHQHARHKYISKLHGLRVTISEVRFFLELRRCQQDIMEAELHETIHSLDNLTPIMADVQKQRKTGVLTVLSREEPPNIRWALQCFFLRGKLAKTEHTLENSPIMTPEGHLEILQNELLLPSIDAQYTTNPPEHLFFFPLYEHTLIQELQERPPQVEE